MDRKRKNLVVDWEKLQRPGFSTDYLADRYERMDLAFDRDDWIPTAAAKALYRNNRPLLAYIGGKAIHRGANPFGTTSAVPDEFTSKDHIFYPGETVEKQIIIINNSRRAVSCDFKFSLNLPRGGEDGRKVSVPAGDQLRIPIAQWLPDTTPPGKYELRATMKFSAPEGAPPIAGETQEDSFAFNVLPRPIRERPTSRIAVFDPSNATQRALRQSAIYGRSVQAADDLSAYDVLVVGKSALNVNGPAINVSRVRDGLRVVVFEQTKEVLEKRFGFRAKNMAYGRFIHACPIIHCWPDSGWRSCATGAARQRSCRRSLSMKCAPCTVRRSSGAAFQSRKLGAAGIRAMWRRC